MNNLEYFEYSGRNPEKNLDTFYKKGVLVIPNTIEVENELIKKNKQLIEYITAFKVLLTNPLNVENIKMKIVQDIIEILEKTQGINYSAFCQFFMVYNSSFSVFKKMRKEEKENFIYEILEKYIKERHDIYMSHGYTNSILQVMSDNYSHKRNSKSGIEKVLSLLKEYDIKVVKNIDMLLKSDSSYFLPDKGGKKLFEQFLEKFDLKMKSREIEQNKLPDIVIKFKEHYYIFELKTMKESGGGQNKQVVEFAHFIRFSEEKNFIHYITFLDSLYANILFSDKSPKVKIVIVCSTL